MYDLCGHLFTLDNIKYQVIQVEELNYHTVLNSNINQSIHHEQQEFMMKVRLVSWESDEEKMISKFLKYKGLTYDEYTEWCKLYRKLEENE